MLKNAARSAFAVAIVASAAIAAVSITVAPANAAHANVSSAMHNVTYYGKPHHGHHHGRPHGYHRPPSHHYKPYYRPYQKPVCAPYRAVGKARSLGLYHAHVSRITSREIVVSGRKYGHYRQLVFARYSPHCALIASRGY